MEDVSDPKESQDAVNRNNLKEKPKELVGCYVKT
jgi:hypothetical protein